MKVRTLNINMKFHFKKKNSLKNGYCMDSNIPTIQKNLKKKKLSKVMQN